MKSEKKDNMTIDELALMMKNGFDGLEKRLGDKIEKNTEMIARNAELITRNSELITINSEKITRNSEKITEARDYIDRRITDLGGKTIDRDRKIDDKI